MNSTVSMECYEVLWSAINHQLVYIDLYRLSLCLYSKLVFPDETECGFGQKRLILHYTNEVLELLVHATDHMHYYYI